MSCYNTRCDCSRCREGSPRDTSEMVLYKSQEEAPSDMFEELKRLEKENKHLKAKVLSLEKGAVKLLERLSEWELLIKGIRDEGYKYE